MPRIRSYADKTNAPDAYYQPAVLKPPTKTKTEQQGTRTGLDCSEELEAAISRCKSKVDAIIVECRARNCRFRDIEFDLEDDKDRCLYVLDSDKEAFPQPADVLRVTQIFEAPQFFIDGPNSSSIAQGALGDCWFLSAVSTVATTGLISRICVHRDEVVGVYGFVFYRDWGWVDVIIDDFLCTRIPKYEELWPNQQEIYHNDKEKYENRARIGGSTLSFSKSKTENETWVPLIEKAFAKLHGDYEAIIGGCDAEAIEALTGGISTLIPIKDILDIDKFWEMLLNPQKDQLFGCAIDNSKVSEITGLFTSHSYSVLEALEVKGKRFVRIRNPWGRSEWKGPWSDGSKEWTSEWLACLPDLHHKFGDDGEFLMEYKDFLKTWTSVERSKLFDADWKLSSMWLNVTARPLPCAWTFGDVSFTFSVTQDSPAAIMLSQLNDRSFEEVSGNSQWSLDFVIYRKGSPSEKPYARSYHSRLWKSRASVELDNLEAGEYTLYARLDRRYYRERTFSQGSLRYWDFRKLSRVRTQESVSKSIAANFEPADCIPASEDLFAEKSHDPPKKHINRRASHHDAATQTNLGQSGNVSEPALSDAEAPVASESGYSTDEDATSPKVNLGSPMNGIVNGIEQCKVAYEDDDGAQKEPVIFNMAQLEQTSLNAHEGFACKECMVSPIKGPWYRCLDAACMGYNICDSCFKSKHNSHNNSHNLLLIQTEEDSRKLKYRLRRGENDAVTLGLRVYTKGQSVVAINGQLGQGNPVTSCRGEY